MAESLVSSAGVRPLRSSVSGLAPASECGGSSSSQRGARGRESARGQRSARGCARGQRGASGCGRGQRGASGCARDQRGASGCARGAAIDGSTHTPFAPPPPRVSSVLSWRGVHGGSEQNEASRRASAMLLARTKGVGRTATIGRKAKEEEPLSRRRTMSTEDARTSSSTRTASGCNCVAAAGRSDIQTRRQGLGDAEARLDVDELRWGGEAGALLARPCPRIHL